MKENKYPAFTEYKHVFMDIGVAEDLAKEIYLEAWSASQQYPAFNSAHEGLAVILEEYEELKAEVFKKQANYDLKRMRKEAIQVGAMALRFIYDICGSEGQQIKE